MSYKTTAELRPGDRVHVTSTRVRTVSTVRPLGYTNAAGVELLRVDYAEGATPDWGPANSAAPHSPWRLAR